jgi:nucleotide-binding universal stress UspA family protein
MGFRHIQVAVDGCEASQAALDQAVWLARQGAATLTGFYILDTGWSDFIGNDWQSSGAARRGFLEHVGREQQGQSDAAQAQFAEATQGLPGARFTLLAGDPIRVLLERLNDADTDLLAFGRRTFQVSGRPSLRTAAATLVKQGRRPLLLFP